MLPSDSARKETLLRRVTLDLTGLPPTLEEVDAFLADESPRAYEKTVDRLLASPRYGERMVWEWLEAARYADSNGYQGDSERTMWPWRDWVIDAMNHDIPFDQFTIEQLAGDLLPNPTRNQRIATGFNRNHMINGEGGRIPEENRVEYVFDQTETFSSVWLGLTVGCARCHDHKYDPIPTADYYSLYGVFRSASEPTLQPIYQPVPDTEERRAFDTEMAKRLKELNEFVAKTRENIIHTARTRTDEYLAAVHAKRNQPSTENFMLLTDKGAINPYVIHRWEMFLNTALRERDPAWAVWHRFAALAAERSGPGQEEG